jgi:hypothetical protein
VRDVEGRPRNARASCGRPVTFQFEHRNGISTDNRLENLEFLCPLCHSQTNTFCGRNSLAARAKCARVLALSHE